MGSFDFARRLDFAHRLPCSVHDGDVLRVQLRWHVLADGLLHVLDAHPIAQRRQRTEEHGVRNRPTQNGRRDAVGVERRGDEFRIGKLGRELEQPAHAGGEALVRCQPHAVGWVHHVAERRRGVRP